MEREHTDAGLTQNAEGASFGVLPHQPSQFLLGKSANAGDARNLKLGGGG